MKAATAKRRTKKRKPWSPRDLRERELWEAYNEDRSDENRNRLSEVYAPYVQSTADRRVLTLPVGSECDADDLFQVGMQSLLSHCIPRFDPGRGFAFLTFATVRIKGAMLDYLRGLDPVSRCYRQRHGDDNPHTRVMSSIERIFDGDRILEFSARIEDRRSPDADRDETNKDLVRRALRGLSAAESRLMRMYHMDGLTMKQVGKKLGMSESRVSQMHSQIMKHLRQRDCAAEFLGN